MQGYLLKKKKNNKKIKSREIVRDVKEITPENKGERWEREVLPLDFFSFVKWSKNCPEGERNRAAYNAILKKFNVLKCFKCEKEIRFLQYFEHHVEWCGRQVSNQLIENLYTEDIQLRCSFWWLMF